MVPQGATEVTIPAGHNFAIAEAGCYAGGSQPPQILRGDDGPDLLNVGSFTVPVDDGPIFTNPSTQEQLYRVRYHPGHEHSHGVATGETGLGFYCGQHYYWSEFAPDEERAFFLTGARRSQIGWLYVDGSGQQVVSCTASRLIFRPPGQ